jgi:hypothetical protein
MTPIDCPSCQRPMGIDENDLNTEWECPVCATSFRVQKDEAGSLHCQITAAPEDSTAVQTQPAQSNRRRRLNRANVEAPAADPNLDISLPQSPLQARFPDLEPGQPPSLFTINGVGFMMYGHRDYDEATGTYVTSACVTVLFVPIFIMSSYRVADAPAEGWFSTGGWHVLGRVPLSPLAKGYNWMMLVVILLALLTCMFSIR